jgi:hypothetical protein
VALQEQIGQRSLQPECPNSAGVGKLPLVDQVILKRDHAKEQIAVNVDGGHELFPWNERRGLPAILADCKFLDHDNISQDDMKFGGLTLRFSEVREEVYRPQA